MASTRMENLAHLSASCPVLSPSKRDSPDKTSAESSHSDEEDIPRASKKQKLFARKLTQRDRKREKEQQRKHENNAISMDDFFSKQTEFRMWLTEEKKKKVGELRSPKLKAYFKTFIKLWNKKKLPQKYYRDVGVEKPCTPVVAKFSLVESTPGKDLVLFPPALDLSLEQTHSPGSSDRPLSTFGKTSPETPEEEEDKENTPTNNLLNSGKLSDSITVRRKRRNTPGSTPVKSGGSLYKVTQLSWNSQGELHVKAVSPNSTPPSQQPCSSPSSTYTHPHHHTPTLNLPFSPSLSTRSKRQAIRVATPTLPAGALGLEKGLSSPATLPKPAWSGQKKVEAVEGKSVAAETENAWGTSADCGQSSSGISSAGSSLSVASTESDLPPGMVRMSRVFVFPDLKTSHGSETSSGSSTECLASAGSEAPTNNAAPCGSIKRMEELNIAEGTASVQSTVWNYSATYTEIMDRPAEKVVMPGAVRKLPPTPKSQHRTCSIAMGSAMLGASPETFASVAVTTAFERNTPTRGSLIKTVPPRPSAKNQEVSSSGPNGPSTPGPSVEGNPTRTGSGAHLGQGADLPLPPPPTSAYLASLTPTSPAMAARGNSTLGSSAASTATPVLGPYADLEVLHGPEAGDLWSGMGRGPYAEPYDSCLGTDGAVGSGSNAWNGTNPSHPAENSQFSSFGKAVVKDHGGVQEISVQESSNVNVANDHKSAVGTFRGSNSKPTVPPTPPPKPPLRTFGRESMKRRSPQQKPSDSGVTDVYAVPMKKRQNSGKETMALANSTPATSTAQVTSPPPPLPPKSKIYLIPRDIVGKSMLTTAQVHQGSEVRTTSIQSGAMRGGRPPCLPALQPSVLSAFPASPSEPTHFWMQVTPPSSRAPREVSSHTEPKAQQMSPIIETSPVVTCSSTAEPANVQGKTSERRGRQDSGKREKAENMERTESRRREKELESKIRKEGGNTDKKELESRERKEGENREKKEGENREKKEGESKEEKEGPGKRVLPFSRDLTFVDKFLKRATGTRKTEKGKKTGNTPSPANTPSSPENIRQPDRQDNAPEPPTPTAPLPPLPPPPLPL